MRIRIPLAPENVDVSKLKVFISYKTEQWERALRIQRALTRLGFQILIVEPNFFGANITDADLRSKLSELVDEADYFCLLVSQESTLSEWVKFEFKEAAQLIGRVVFVADDKLRMPDRFKLPLPEPSDLTPTLFVKHTTLTTPEDSPEWTRELAVQLLNDPDEGYFDGRSSPGERFAPRDLRRENKLTRIARKYVLIDHKYCSRVAIDVLPFSWDEVTCEEGDINGVLKWFIFNRGRLRLEDALLNDEIDIFYTWYWIPEANFMKVNGSELLNVLVVLRHDA